MKNSFVSSRALRVFFALTLGLVASSSFAGQGEGLVKIKLEGVKKAQILKAYEGQLKLLRGNISLEEIKNKMTIQLEQKRKAASEKGTLSKELDQEFQASLNKINSIESKDELILKASNAIDEMNSTGQFIFKLAGTAAVHASDAYYGYEKAFWAICGVFGFAFDVAFLWLEIPAQIIWG